MIALLRYMFLKSWRDRSLIAFTLFSAGSMLTARIGIAVVELIRGVRLMDESFGPDMMPGLVFGSVTMATIASFWVLRVEIRDWSIGSVLLAVRAPLIASAVTIYAVLIGMVSFLLSIPMVGTQVPRDIGSFGNLVSFTILSLIVGGASGIAIAAVSPEPPMIIVACAAVITIIVAAFTVIESAAIAGAVVATVLLIATTSLLLERRCAS